MRILIVGAGAIGVYLGTKLSSNYNDVTLLGRKKLKKLNDTILIGETPYKLPRRVYHMPISQIYDFIFVTSKLFDLRKNLQLIKKNNLNTKYLVSIQNSIVDERLYKPYVKDTKFTSISVFEGFRLIENQLAASYSRIGWRTDFSDAGKAASKLLINSGIKCLPEKNLDSIKAEKTVMNCSVNLLSAIEKKTFYELCESKKTRQMIDALFDESYTVLNKLYAIENKQVLRRRFYHTVSKMRHYSSTYQDAIANRKNEAGFLNGLIVRMGRNMQIPTPENYRLLKKFYKQYPKSE